MLNLGAIKARCRAVTTKGPGYSDSDGDTEFLICARADVPALVVEIERLREKLEWILDEATSDFNRDIIITECQSALAYNN